MGAAAGPLAIAAGVVQGIGQIAQGAGQSAAYSNNARVALQQAEVARQQSYVKAAMQARQTAQVAGAQQAAYGAAGVAPSLWVMSDTARQGEMARQIQLYQGRAEAQAQQRQADIMHQQAVAARNASYIGAAGTLLGSMASAGKDWFNAPSSGGGGLEVPTLGKIMNSSPFDPTQLLPQPASL